MLRVATLPPQHVQTLIKSFVSRVFNIILEKFYSVDFDHIKGNINWATLDPSCSEFEKAILVQLFPKGSVKLARGVLKHFQYTRFLEQIRRASLTVHLNRLESASRTFL